VLGAETVGKTSLIRQFLCCDFKNAPDREEVENEDDEGCTYAIFANVSVLSVVFPFEIFHIFKY